MSAPGSGGYTSPPGDSATAPRPSASQESARKRAPLRRDDGRLVRGRRSRDRILRAARELFEERGFDRATLRAIAERAGMGASSIYRHVRSKEELLIDELTRLQEEAWHRFRQGDERTLPTRERVHRFLDVQHELLVADRDFTAIALRATTKPEARVARQVLALNDRTVGLLMEILQMGRMRNDLAKDVEVLEAARVVFSITQGARIPWANGLVTDEVCRNSIQSGVDLLFKGLDRRSDSPE
jgi:AcrR family transcriptional regulator